MRGHILSRKAKLPRSYAAPAPAFVSGPNWHLPLVALLFLCPESLGEAGVLTLGVDMDFGA